MNVIQTIKDSMQNDNSRKTFFALGLVVVVIVVLAFVTYFFFYNTDSQTYDDIDFSTPQVTQEAQVSTQVSDSANAVAQITEINPTDNIANANTDAVNANIESQAISTDANEPSLKSLIAQNDSESVNSVSQLKYAIKPLDKHISSCGNMKNGKWNMPDSCSNDMINAIKKLIETNNEIIAIEVSGIVDNNPYAGPSAELKQEGLASFRAREAIGVITRNFSSIAVFEGLSIQSPNKRGFEVKAYYLQK